MIKAIIFDVDGVLVNAEKFSIQLGKEYGIPTEKLLPFFKKEFQECLLGKADLKDVIEPYLAEWGWKGSVDDFLQFWFKSEHKIDEEVLNIAKHLKEKTLIFIATNQEEHRASYLSKEMGFGEVFKRIYSSARIGHLKESPNFFHLMVEDIQENFSSNIKHNEILFFDDTERNVKAAKEAGLNAYLYTDIETFKKELITRNLLWFK